MYASSWSLLLLHGLNSCLLFACLLLFVGVSLELFQMGGSFIFRFDSFFSTHNKVILLLLISSLFCFVFSLFCIEVFQEGLRKDTSFEDPDLQSLSSRLQATVLLAKAPGTVNMYDRAFRKWREFALRKKELSYFPANPMHVAVYLQYVLESTRSRASVDTAFIVSSGLTSQRVLYPPRIILAGCR